jgi:hypothetical protein
MNSFETTLTHDFYLQQHPYRVLLAFERFVTLTHLQEWKQQQAVWDLREDGCLWITYVYIRDLRHRRRMKGKTLLGNMCSGIVSYQGSKEYDQNILFRFTFRVEFLQIKKGQANLLVKTITREEIDPVPSFNHRDFYVDSSLDLIGNLGIELERALLQSGY